MNEIDIMMPVDSAALLVTFVGGFLMGFLLCLWFVQEQQCQRAEHWIREDRKRLKRKELEVEIRNEIKTKEAQA